MKIKRTLSALAVAAIAALLLTSCGSGGDGGSGDAGGSDGGPVVDVAAAKAFVEPFQEVSEFPVSEPLSQSLSPDTTAVFLDNGTAVAALQATAMKEAAETMGIQLTVVSTGASPLEISNALDSVVEMKPDILLAVAIDPELWAKQLETLRDAGTTVVAAAIVNGDQFGFGDDVMSGRGDSELVGEIMVADLLAKGDGATTDLAFYVTPELAFTAAVQAGAESKLAELCPDCTLRIVQIPITEVGTTAPQTIVSDLQAHPETQGMVFSFDELQVGLPAALRVAQIDVPGIGWAPTPPNLEAITQGEQYAGIGMDLPVYMWTVLDQAARALIGDELSEAQKSGYTVKQIVVQDNVPADFSHGWSAYPDYQERFAALWNR
jgi:ribose transport system substrate-binding protein